MYHLTLKRSIKPKKIKNYIFHNSNSGITGWELNDTNLKHLASETDRIKKKDISLKSDPLQLYKLHVQGKLE